MPPILTPTPVGGSGGGLTQAQVEALVIDSAPATLNTLNELAAALGDDADFVGSVVADLAGKVSTSDGGQEIRQVHGDTGATETIDVANGNVHVVTQDQACVYTFTNPSSSTSACSFTLIMTAVTGAATWPASVNWPDGGAAPTLSGRCMLVFVTTDGGTTWDGVLAASGLA